MKKISQPNDQRLEVSPHAISMNEVPLNEVPLNEVPLNEVATELPEQREQRELPSKMYDYDLKKIKSFKEMRSAYKAKSQKQVFLNDLSVLLDEYKPEEHKYDLDLLLHILNISESFFVFGSKDEREEAKVSSVKELMLKYFGNDDDILDIMIGSVMPKVKKITLIKRWMRRLRLWLKKKI
jgi:hypothetical protein